MSYTAKKYNEDSRPASASEDVSCDLAGMRVQLMKALCHVHHGALLVYRLKTNYIESEAQRLLGGYFIQNHNWLNEEVEPLFVPGTLCPDAIGRLLMRFGWVSPADNEECGYARCYVLSDAGEKALEDARAWWNSLSWFQKAWLHMTE